MKDVVAVRDVTSSEDKNQKRSEEVDLEVSKVGINSAAERFVENCKKEAQQQFESSVRVRIEPKAICSRKPNTQ